MHCFCYCNCLNKSKKLLVHFYSWRPCSWNRVQIYRNHILRRKHFHSNKNQNVTCTWLWVMCEMAWQDNLYNVRDYRSLLFSCSELRYTPCPVSFHFIHFFEFSFFIETILNDNFDHLFIYIKAAIRSFF